MNIKLEIENLLKKVIQENKYFLDGEVVLERPQSLEFGDWTTNLALQVAGKAGKNPREFAEQIRAQIPQNEKIEKIEIAGPGYLNFYISEKEKLKALFELFKIGSGGKSEIYPTKSAIFFNSEIKESEEILLEHSSPNLFKPFHIGHMVNNAIGESLGRILKIQGQQVKQVSFPSDVSPGIAKTI
jgi:arginyl-tRNA synthetase